jgi:outer membrane protein assembly factor BamB
MKLDRLAALALAALLPSCGGSSGGGSSGTPPLSGPAAWAQWGQGPQHAGAAGVAGQNPDRLLADVVVDPFTTQEQAASGGSLLVHYPVPLVTTDDVFVLRKGGTYSSAPSWDTQQWSWRRMRWDNGQLVETWTFASDWKPEPNGGPLAGWEPVNQAVLVGGSLYVPGQGGTVIRLDAVTGATFGSAVDATIFVAGPLAADATGNVYYNAIQLDPTDPWGRDARDAWLVRISPDDRARTVRFAALTAGAPGPGDPCLTTFPTSSLPWPPSPDAVPPAAPCGSQRPGINVAPAVAPDGTIYTLSRAHFNGRYGFLMAVNPDLTPKWIASLRDRLGDGCGVPASEGGVLSPNGAPGGCRAGARRGVDPATNRAGDGVVADQSSSTPVVLPDGSVLYGAFTRYNYSRGHLLKFGSSGQFLAAHDFGWDVTPAVYERGGTYSVLIKDNHYESARSYCSDPSFCTLDPRAETYSVVQLRGDTLAPEWSYVNPNRREWCINAPAVDRNGTVYGTNEDGTVYAIGQGGAPVRSLFLRQVLEAAYTPLALDGSGRIYAQNAGHLFVLGR